jgi:hypothetical protein
MICVKCLHLHFFSAFLLFPVFYIPIYKDKTSMNYQFTFFIAKDLLQMVSEMKLNNFISMKNMCKNLMIKIMSESCIAIESYS